MHHSIKWLVIWATIFPIYSLHAWENHALPTAITLSAVKEIVNANKIRVESLDDFLKSEAKFLKVLLIAEEKWAKDNVRNYAPLPQALALSDKENPSKSMRARFLEAIRVNPESRFALYLQELPGQSKNGVTYHSAGDVTLMPNSLPTSGSRFVKLSPNQMVAPMDVFVSAADEPDYGLDVKLWSDSGTSFGARYGFGPQPYGDPELEYSSQAPFHMGFFHEWRLLNVSATNLMGALVEYRIHQFFSLARFAFERGHPYWGWRFAGMGVHYVQDLTQPYHSTVLPGANTLVLLWGGLLDKLGIEGPKSRLAKQASTKHTAIEKYMCCNLVQGLSREAPHQKFLHALQKPSGSSHSYTSSYVREILTAESHSFADRVATAMDSVSLKAAASKDCSLLERSAQNDALFAQLLGNFATHTRSWIQSVRPAIPLQAKATVETGREKLRL